MILRLELLGFIMFNFICVLNPFQEKSLFHGYVWTDSKVLLTRTEAFNKEFQTFFQNRIVEI